MLLKKRVAPAAHWLAYVSGLSTALSKRQECARILMFHGVDSDGAKVFASQIEYLAAHFDIVSLDAALERLRAQAPPARREVVLTFDDGLRNNYTVVYPILKRLGVPATYFVCPGLVESGRWLWNHDARERLRALTPAQRAVVCASITSPESEVEDILEWMKTLDPVRRGGVEDAIRSATPGFEPTSLQRERFDVMRWNELAALDPDLITIGSHTVTHPILTTLDHSALVFEIQESRRWLERRLGRAVEHFCYPSGAYNAAVIGCVRDCYRSAVAATEAGVVAGDDRYCLHRIPSAGDVPLLAWRLHRPEA